MSARKNPEWATLQANCPAIAGFLSMVFAKDAPEIAKAFVFLVRRTGTQLLKITDPGDETLRDLVREEIARGPKSAFLTNAAVLARYHQRCRVQGVKPMPRAWVGRYLRQMLAEQHGAQPRHTGLARGYSGVVLKKKGKA